jgi:hypothetical protein
MLLYSGAKDETRINIAELSEKELLDEVRRLTLFSQEDSIPLMSSYTPLDAPHPQSEVIFLLTLLLRRFLLVDIITIILICSFLRQIPIVSGNLHDSPNDTSEGRGSSVPVDFHTVEHTGPEDEYNGLIDFEVAHSDLPSSADNAGDADGSMRNDNADRDTFVDAAAEEARASPTKRSTGGFADEDDLFDM